MEGSSVTKPSYRYFSPIVSYRLRPERRQKPRILSRSHNLGKPYWLTAQCQARGCRSIVGKGLAVTKSTNV